MEFRVRFENFAAGICLTILSGMVYADDAMPGEGLPTAASFYTRNLQLSDSRQFDFSPYLLADNETGIAAGSADSAPADPAAKFEPPLISGRKAHEYLGLGTVLFAGLTALAAPGEGCESCTSQPSRQTSGTTHTRLARTTGALAIATVVTGLLYHWDDFDFDDGWKDPDNQHVVLAGSGALLMLYAINKSAKSSVPTTHAPYAVAGAGLMLVAIKLNW